MTQPMTDQAGRPSASKVFPRHKVVLPAYLYNPFFFAQEVVWHPFPFFTTKQIKYVRRDKYNVILNSVPEAGSWGIYWVYTGLRGAA